MSRTIASLRPGRRAAVAGLLLAPIAPAMPAFAAATDFNSWLQGLRSEAQAKGISRRVIDDALAGLAPIPRIIELDRRQPEVVQTLEAYLASRITQTKIDNGRRRLVDNAGLFAQVQQRFNVQPSFITALWGLESDYGRFMGDFSTVASLATLAYDGRRSAFFREELLNALRVLERKGMRSAELRGSWAGAMGQCQFMPSNYLAYAVDHDGDGKADIWNNLGDVFASIANFLGKLGWKGDEGWGYEVTLPAGFERGLVDPESVRRPVTEWQALGVRRLGGGALTGRDAAASLSQPDGAGSRAFLVTSNFRTLRRWNSPQRFRIAVGLLADRLSAA
ncbi:MAG: lytic murein transglycosylase [Alphaproteobacteria bacterium]|nr:lytic murein transglycosylase [Alphaproteobacteria bacterium]